MILNTIKNEDTANRKIIEEFESLVSDENKSSRTEVRRRSRQKSQTIQPKQLNSKLKDQFNQAEKIIENMKKFSEQIKNIVRKQDNSISRSAVA